MKPGRELDLLVAEKVMGDTIIRREQDNEIISYCKPYSTDIAAAWEVVEKMKEENILEIHVLRQSGVEIFFYDLEGDRRRIIADTAPHAICLAALKAKGVEV
jgi:hypothetical protein